MPYQTPDLQQLSTLAVDLKQKYDGKNPQRLAFIELASKLINNPNPVELARRIYLLLGLYVFELESIENEYYVLSPENSSTYRIIKEGLNCTNENVLTQEQRLVYLSFFYNFLRTDIPPNFVNSEHWRSKDNLLLDTKKCIQSLLKKQSNPIQALLQSPPAEQILKDNIPVIKQAYLDIYQSRYIGNAERVLLVRLMEFINHTADQVARNDISDSSNEHFSTSHMVRLGLLIFIMMEISGGYHVTSPKNSDLYELCLSKTKLNDLSNYTIDNKILWLSQFNTHIQLLRSQHKNTLRIAESNGFYKIDKYLEKISDKLATHIADLTKARNSSSSYFGCVGSAASYGASSVSSQIASRYLLPKAGAILLNVGAPAIGATLFGSYGGILALPITYIISNNLIPEALANAFAMVVIHFGGKVGKEVTKPIAATVRGLRDFLGLCREKCAHDSNPNQNREWIDALLSLPDEIFEEPKKAQVRNTCGFEVPIDEIMRGSSNNH